jgi:hypothetical protein
MEWVTRARPKTDRIACPWLIRRFIDPEARIVYVPPDEVLSYAEAHGARSFDAPGAEFTHREGKCTFEVLIEDFGLHDPALSRLALIVHGADISGRSTPRRSPPDCGRSLRVPTRPAGRPATPRRGGPDLRRPVRMVPPPGFVLTIRPSPR